LALSVLVLVEGGDTAAVVVITVLLLAFLLLFVPELPLLFALEL
jgi:hypothetical protein